MQLALGYFEGWAQHRYGVSSAGGRSKELFRRGFVDVFYNFWNVHPTLRTTQKEVVDLFYQEARCGAFHDGLVRRRIFFQAGQEAAMKVAAHKRTGKLSVIIVDVEKFLVAVEGHFSRYVAQLQDPTNGELRDNFLKAWKMRHGGPPLHLPPELGIEH